MKQHLLCLLLLASVSVASAQSTAFTYQGHLMDGGASANGNYDIQFTLKNALTAGATVGTPQAVSPVTAVNGIFTATLDFGGTAFDGSDRWLELAVRPFGSGSPHTVLTPRQKLTSTPYSVRAVNAASATTAASATNAVNLTGTLTAGNIPANLITGPMLANNTLTSAQIQNGAVSTTQLATGAVTLAKISPTSAAGYLGQGVLSGLTGGTATATVTFPQAFGSAPPVVVQSPGWTLGAVTASGFSASTPFAPVTVDSSNNVGYYTSLAVINGRAAISYYDSNNGDLKFSIARRADGSGPWTTVTVDSAGIVGSYSSLAVVDGRPAISYYDSTNNRLKFAISPTADGSGAWTILGLGGVANGGEYTSLAVVNGVPAISLRDNGNSDLIYSYAGTADGYSAWGVIKVDNLASVGSHTSLAVINGRPAISYMDESNGDLKYAIATLPSGASDWTKVTVDSAGTVGEHTSLAMVNGRPAISYRDATNGDLKWAIAATPDGSGTWTTRTLDSSGDVGSYTSLAVVNGRPAISYFDSTNFDLKYAIAPTADGSGVWAVMAVHSADSVGYFTSLEMVNGRPSISYTDITNGVLKYAHLPDSPWYAGDATASVPMLASSVQAGVVGTAQLTAGAVTSDQLAAAAVDGSKIATGAITAAKLDSQLSADLARLGSAQTFTAANTFGNASNSFTGSGGGLTALNAGNVSTGTLNDARLSSNVALRAAANTFASTQTINTTADTPLNLASSHIGGTWVYISNTSSGGRTWNLISTGSNNGEGAGKLLLRDGNIGAVRLTIDTNGNTGIGRVPTANRLEIEGDASKSSAGSWLANSDRRIKEDIEPIKDALETLDKVRLVDFRYTDDYRAGHPGIADQRYLNVVAQEFRQVFPDHVKSSGEKLPDGSDILQVDTYPLTIYSAAAVQELHRENKELKARIERLEKLIEKGAGK